MHIAQSISAETLSTQTNIAVTITAEKPTITPVLADLLVTPIHIALIKAPWICAEHEPKANSLTLLCIPQT
jgi:hypothetical protein